MLGKLVATGGLIVLLMIVFQIATGKRWINLGRNTQKFHRIFAWVILAFAIVHGIAALEVFII